MRKRLTERLVNKLAAAGLRREISDDFKYDKKKLKHLKHILHNVNIAQGTLVSALNEFARIKGPAISPDGLLGGLGYIMPIKDVKEVLNVSIKGLSDIADSLADELTNPHWNAEEDKDVKELLKEKEEVEEKIEESQEAPSDDSSEPESESDDTNSDEGPEEESEEPEEIVAPEDVITSKNIEITAKKATQILAKSVKQNLVKFHSIGKTNS